MYTVEKLVKEFIELLTANESVGSVTLLFLVVVKGALYQLGKRLATLAWGWSLKRYRLISRRPKKL